jgi:hypothetical protein
VSGGDVRPLAGALTVYKRPDASSTFSLAGQLFLPNPEAYDLLGWPMHLASNGVYAAVTSAKHLADIRIFQVHPTMQYVTTIPHPHGAPPRYLFITNQNIVVADSGGFPAPFAWKLNGSQATPVDTSMLGDPFSETTTGDFTGDGDSIAWVSNYAGSYLLRTAKFGVNSVSSSSVQYLPAEHVHDQNELPMTLEEGQGLFVTNRSSSWGNVISSYKYVGDRYRYQGILYNYSANHQSLAFNGTDLLVGDRAPQHQMNVPCDGGFGSVWVHRPMASSSPGPGTGSATLQPWMHVQAGGNGQSVAIDGAYAVSGSPWTGHAASTGGAAYLYQNVNGAWQQVEQYVDSLNAARGGGWSMFGVSVDINTNSIVVGAPYGTNGWGISTGNVQFVTQQNGVFRSGPYLDEIPSPNWEDWGQGFGNAVALAGNTLFVGAPGWGIPPESARAGGSVYVFDWDGFNWMFRQELHNPAVLAYESFGYRVAASGDYAIVGIPYRSSNGLTGNGSVEIFRRDPGTGTYVSAGEFFAPSELGDWSTFGDAVTIGSDFAAAGSYNGTVAIFRRSGTSWFLETTITPNQSGFGSSLAIEGSNLVVGSPWESRVHRYQRFTWWGSGYWYRSGTLVGNSSSFGSSADMVNGEVMLGESYGAIGGVSIGASHVLNFGNVQ